MTTTMLKVLQLHNQYVIPGGEDTIADDEAKLLAAAGHIVDRYRVRNPTDKKHAVAAVAGAAWNPMQARALRDRIRETKPDVCHLHNTWFTLSPAVIHTLHDEGVPMVMTLQNYRLLCANALFFRDGQVCTKCLDGHIWRAVKHRCYHDSVGQSALAATVISTARVRGTWQLVDRFLAASNFVKSKFVEGGFAQERITVRPNLAPDCGARTTRPSESKTVLYVGRLSREKGVDVLVDAWARAGAAVQGLELVIVGDGPLRQELEDRAVPDVRFTGWLQQAEVAQLMLTARTNVLPSQVFETFGRSMVEAMAAAMPVIASDISTPGEIVGELGANWLVEPTNGDAWVRALAQLTDDALIDRDGARARELFDLKYSPQAAVSSLERVYRSVIAER